MKRWELAKSKGLNWQVLLIQDCETDIKLITLESVKLGEDYGTTNKKVVRLINECVDGLESEELKRVVKQTLPKFASRIYLQWLNIYGNKSQGVALITLFSLRGVNVPEKTRKTLTELPIERKEVYPDYVYNRATANKEYYERVNKVLDQSAKEDYSERYSLRAKSEVQVRYEIQQKRLQSLYESGNDLVWIDTHANCSERCEPWQGKLYSISDRYGTIDGISYQPLSNATDRYDITKSGKTYLNGTLTGFNCRHTTTPYTKGSKPSFIPEEVIERQRELETRQRQLERNVRFYENRALGWRNNSKIALTSEEKEFAIKTYKHNKDLVRKWQNEYADFCRKNNIPQYPSRLKI